MMSRTRVEIKEKLNVGSGSSPVADDYSAAHSMDTEWFAIDGEGR